MIEIHVVFFNFIFIGQYQVQSFINTGLYIYIFFLEQPK
jgi:hypothetical protein